MATICPVFVQPEAIATVAVVGARDVDTQLFTLVLAAVTFVDVWAQTKCACFDCGFFVYLFVFVLLLICSVKVEGLGQT